MESEVIAELGRRTQDVEPEPHEPSPMERTFAEIVRGRFPSILVERAAHDQE